MPCVTDIDAGAFIVSNTSVTMYSDHDHALADELHDELLEFDSVSVAKDTGNCVVLTVYGHHTHFRVSVCCSAT